MEIKYLGCVDYLQTFDAMREHSKNPDAADEIWICEHKSVFTLGLAGKNEHILNPHNIQQIKTDRGGQVTYHGAGQVIAYPLISLKKRNIFVKEYVYRLEEAVLRTLQDLEITGHRVAGAPGIYVKLSAPQSHEPIAQRPQKNNLGKAPDFTGLGKIAALGVKVTNGRSYHGVALNVDMDLTPYTYINPCGYQGLQTIDLATIGKKISPQEVSKILAGHLNNLLSI